MQIDEGADWRDHLIAERSEVLEGFPRLVYSYRGEAFILVQSKDVVEGTGAVLRGVGRYFASKLRPDGRRSRLYAMTVSKGARPADCRRDWATLLELYRAGEVRPIVGAQMPLEEAAEAHRMLEAGEVAGKIVLVTGAR